MQLAHLKVSCRFFLFAHLCEWDAGLQKIAHERLDGDILIFSHEISKEEHADALASVSQ